MTSDASGQNRAGILDIETGKVRWLGKEGVEEHAVRFSQNGRLLAAVRNFESSVRPVIYEVETGAPHELKLPGGYAVGASFFDGDKKLLVTFSSDVTRGSLVSYDLATDTYETLLPAEYGTIDRSVFVEAKHVYYDTFDGRKIPALLYTPRGIAAGEKLPALVHVHGGPTGQWFRGLLRRAVPHAAAWRHRAQHTQQPGTVDSGTLRSRTGAALTSRTWPERPSI